VRTSQSGMQYIGTMITTLLVQLGTRNLRRGEEPARCGRERPVVGTCCNPYLICLLMSKGSHAHGSARNSPRTTSSRISEWGGCRCYDLSLDFFYDESGQPIVNLVAAVLSKSEGPPSSWDVLLLQHGSAIHTDILLFRSLRTRAVHNL